MYVRVVKGQKFGIFKGSFCVSRMESSLMLTLMSSDQYLLKLAALRAVSFNNAVHALWSPNP